MRCRRHNFLFIIMMAGLIFSAWPFFKARAENPVERLSGRILLQVQSVGEAWYVNPVNDRRYYLGRPSDAFDIMRRLGLGVSETDYQKIASQEAARLKGRIILRVQAAGEAYYVDPVASRLYYLGRPSDAFDIMRRLGLGVSNQDLAQIAVAADSTITADTTRSYIWHYQDQAYNLTAELSPTLYQAYRRSPKVYTYYAVQEPPDLREAFYGLFLKTRADDGQTDEILSVLRQQAAGLGFSADQTAAFILAFIQYLPYDRAKADADDNNPYYPFETLYLQRGVCADKTFLAVLYLRRLGYGAAILDFPESNHSAAGIACPVADSLAGSGYCYVETTNYFPVGVVPPTLANGQASSTSENLDNLFTADRLGKMEIKQKSQGKIYQGVATVKATAAALQIEHQNLEKARTDLRIEENSVTAAYDALKKQESILLAYKAGGNLGTYNQLVPAYNNDVTAYQTQIGDYERATAAYNLEVQTFNQHYRAFYQQ